MTDESNFEYTDSLLQSSNRVSITTGVKWIFEAFRIFKRNFIIWILITFLYLACYTFCIYFLNILTADITNLITSNTLATLSTLNIEKIKPIIILITCISTLPVIVAGIYYAAHQSYNGNNVSFFNIFYGFKKRVFKLFTLGFVSIIFITLITVIGYGLFDTAKDMFENTAVRSKGTSFVLTSFVFVIAWFFMLFSFLMSIVYSPILITFHNLNVLHAMHRSFKACLKNSVFNLLFPFYVFIFFCSSLLLKITSNIAGIIIAPIFFIIIYLSYRSLFLEE